MGLLVMAPVQTFQMEVCGLLFRYRILAKTMGPLFHAFKVSFVVVEALVVAFLLNNSS